MKHLIQLFFRYAFSFLNKEDRPISQISEVLLIIFLPASK